MSGTVNIARAIFDHPGFADEPKTEREAFIWLVMEASWKPRDKRVGTIVAHTERGQLAASVRFLAGAWKWTAAKVQRYLKRLEKREMIRTQADTGLTIITICNYDEYQSGGKPADTAPIQQRYTTDTNEKKDEIREEGKKDANASSRSPAPKIERFQEFWDFYPHRNGNKQKRSDCEKSYAKAVRSGVPELRIIEAAIRAQNDPDVKRGYGRAALPWLNQRGWEDEIQPAQPTLTLIPGGPREQSAADRRAASSDDAFYRVVNAAAGTGYSS